MERLIEHTADGSATLYVPRLDEHYHSVKGARTESQHIFVDMGLKACPVPAPHILEIGFGTGLNALLTLEEAERSHRTVHYTGVERYPLAWEEVEPLHYSDHPLFPAMHRAPWEADVPLTPGFTLHKMQVDACELSTRPLPPVHVVYFDAFAPEKQPEMWDEALFRQRSRPPDVAVHRLPGRTPARPSGRETRDTARRQALAFLWKGHGRKHQIGGN